MISFMLQELETIESLLRRGEGAKALESLGSIAVTKLKRAEKSQFANLARRLGETRKALNILRPYVRPSSQKPEEASDLEKLEYSMALIKIGALKEGLSLIGEVEDSGLAFRYLYNAFGKIAQWKYKEAICDLEKYIQHKNADPYYIQTAKVNLLTCYAYSTEYEKSLALANELLEETKKSGSKLLHRHLLMQAAQINLFLGRYSDSRKFLEKATIVSDMSTDPASRMLISKWNLLLDLYEHDDVRALSGRFKSIRKEAEKLNYSEIKRDLHLYESLFKNDLERLNFVYYGTSYSSYKQKIKDTYLLKHKKELPLMDEFIWYPVVGSQEGPWVKLSTGENSCSEAFLKPGHLNHQLLKLFCSDFYKPIGLHRIHDQVFSEEYFNPNTSPKKIKQSVFRLNKWFKESSLPLEVRSQDTFYQLNAIAPVQILISETKSLDPRLKEFLIELKSAFSDGEFTSIEVSKSLDIPRRTVSRNLDLLKAEGALVNLGKGRNTKFKLC